MGWKTAAVAVSIPWSVLSLIVPSYLVEVEELVIQRCRRLLQQQQLIQGLTFYHWWPEVETAA